MDLQERMWEGRHPYFWAVLILLLHPVRTAHAFWTEITAKPRVGDVRLRNNKPAQTWDGSRWKDRS